MTDRREQASRGAVALGEPGGELGAYQDLANDHQGDTAAPHPNADSHARRLGRRIQRQGAKKSLDASAVPTPNRIQSRQS